MSFLIYLHDERRTKCLLYFFRSHLKNRRNNSDSNYKSLTDHTLLTCTNNVPYLNYLQCT